MLMIVGLGNPGSKHALQRHNVGFMAIDVLAEVYSAPPFRQKFQGLASECRIEGVKTLLLKPQTFMNDSGRSVGAAAQFYKIAPANILVIHDELDLAEFKIKLKLGGGTAGHNGLKSIAAHLGTNDFKRLRFGIGHPGAKPLVLKHVLGNFSKAELEHLPEILGAVAAEAKSLVTGDDARFLSDLAQRLR
ncbi:MAG: aminoacyl-tRNA hydrolase [Pseudomonadota bacterium]